MSGSMQRPPSESAATQPIEMHRAAWLVPVCSPPIENGAVLVSNGRILEVDRYDSIQAVAPSGAKCIDHGPSALVPALVNAHAHLGLTGMEGTIPLPQASFESWLREMLSRRPALTLEMQREGLEKGASLLRSTGTVLCGDISNGNNGFALPPESISHLPLRCTFLEVLGFNCPSLATAVPEEILRSFLAAATRDPFVSLAAHACYSTSGDLIRETKAWCRAGKRVFSMHTAEHPEEIRFLADGSGPFREILQGLDRWAPDWTPPRSTPIEYLERLGVLDPLSLLVHVVHMTEADWEILSRNGSGVCFCPRSNENIGGPPPDIQAALRRSIPTALGTDSLASNTSLNLFHEGTYVLDHYPGLSPTTVFSMMTLGGARVLQQSDRFGSIRAGRQSALLSVSLPKPATRFDLEETIIFQGQEGAWRWACYPTMN